MCLCVSVRERRSGLVSLEVESCGGDDLKDLNVYLISYFIRYKYNTNKYAKRRQSLKRKILLFYIKTFLISYLLKYP